jgi:hypothetical protein
LSGDDAPVAASRAKRAGPNRLMGSGTSDAVAANPDLLLVLKGEYSDAKTG